MPFILHPDPEEVGAGGKVARFKTGGKGPSLLPEGGGMQLDDRFP